MLRDVFVRSAYEFVGTKEKSAEHQTIVDMYNAIVPLPRGYKVTVLDPWCAIFVSAMLSISGVLDLIPVAECSCTKMLTMFKMNPKYGTVVTEQTDPTMDMISYGDLIFYGPKASPVGESSHVGIVYAKHNYDIKTIEGNWRNSVYMRMRQCGTKVWDGVAAYVKIKFPDEVWQGELAAAKNWCVTEELIKGDENGINWKEPVTLERLAVILHRLCTT